MARRVNPTSAYRALLVYRQSPPSGSSDRGAALCGEAQQAPNREVERTIYETIAMTTGIDSVCAPWFLGLDTMPRNGT